MRKLITCIILSIFLFQSTGTDYYLSAISYRPFAISHLRPIASAISNPPSVMAPDSERLINVHIGTAADLQRYFVPENAQVEYDNMRKYKANRVLLISDINDTEISADDIAAHPEFFSASVYNFSGGHISACLKRVVVSLCQQLGRPVTVNIILDNCFIDFDNTPLYVIFDDYYLHMIGLEGPGIMNFTISYNGEIMPGFGRTNDGPVKKICFWDNYKLMRAGTSTPKPSSAGQGSQEDLFRLIAQLQDKELSRRKDAANLIGDMGILAYAAIPALEEALNDPDRLITMESAEAIRGIDCPQSRLVLEKAIRSGGRFISLAAIKAIRYMNPPLHKSIIDPDMILRTDKGELAKAARDTLSAISRAKPASTMDISGDATTRPIALSPRFTPASQKTALSIKQAA